MDQLRLEVGHSTFECFLKRMRRFKNFYRLTSLQETESQAHCPVGHNGEYYHDPQVEPGLFTFEPMEFVLAGQLFEQEVYDYTCCGIVPTYERHPAYGKFIGNVK